MKKTRTQDEQRALMRERLKSPAQGRNRANSIAGDVRALDDDIAEQRALGKTWRELATDMYENPDKADAVRAAFTRLRPTRQPSTPRTDPEPPLAQNREAAKLAASPPLRGAAGAGQTSFFTAVHDPFDQDQVRASGEEA